MQIFEFSENQMVYQEMYLFLNYYSFEKGKIREQLIVYFSYCFFLEIEESLDLRVNALRDIYHRVYFALRDALSPLPILNKADYQE